MASFRIQGHDLVLAFSGWEVVGGVRRGARVALAWVDDVRVDDRPWSIVRGIRVGTGIPGVILLGTMLRAGKNDVVAIYGRAPVVVVSLTAAAPWQRLIATAAEPHETAAMIREALTAEGDAFRGDNPTHRRAG